METQNAPSENDPRYDEVDEIGWMDMRSGVEDGF